MSTAVLGPGAVGGALAVRLAQSGEHVICVARPETAAAIREGGLTLVTDDAEETVWPQSVEQLDEPVDLLLVTVKSYSLDDGVSRIGPEPALVLPLLNGLEHMHVLRSRFRTVVAATIGRFEGYRESPTRIIQQTSGLVRVAADEAPEQLLRSGIDTQAGGSDEDVLWWKLARQGPIAVLTAVLGKPIGELRSDPRFRLAVEEACAVAAADGAHTTFEEQWAIIETLPAWATSSTERDVTAGRPSELDHIAGGIVRAGRRLGVPTPTLEGLLKQCPA